MKTTLTELAIKRLKPKEKPYRVSDNGGLCIEITPSDSKLWRWRYYFNNKPQMMALGKHPAVGLAKARKLRDEAREILDAGKNPTAEKKAAKLRQISKGENTFEKIATRWLDLKKDGLNPKYHKQCHERMKQHIFPDIGALPIANITIPDIVRVIENIAARGCYRDRQEDETTHWTRFRYASQRGLCEHNPAADLRSPLKT